RRCSISGCRAGVPRVTIAAAVRAWPMTDAAIDGRPVLLSGIAPSGRLTLGNYLGAIRNWVSRQDAYRCYFPLVDLHAITVRQDPASFAHRCRDFIALYLACGIDPTRSVVFVQSHVPQHAELAWILQCFTQLG